MRSLLFFLLLSLFAVTSFARDARHGLKGVRRPPDCQHHQPHGVSPPELLVQLARPDAPEAITFGDNGHYYVSMIFTGQVVEFDENNVEVQRYNMPPVTLLMGSLLFDRGHLLMTLSSPIPGQTGLWDLDLATGNLSQFAWMPSDLPVHDIFGTPAMLNGLAANEFGEHYVADSQGGFVWRVGAAGGEMELWKDVEAPLGPGVPSPDNAPGPNGLRLGPNGNIYLAISSQGRIVQIPINDDGSAGEMFTFVDNVTPDDFAFDYKGNLYLATEPSNSVEMFSADGRTRVELADYGDGLQNSTSVTFSLRNGELSDLYITNGGIEGYGDHQPSIMVLHLNKKGYPLPRKP